MAYICSIVSFSSNEISAVCVVCSKVKRGKGKWKYENTCHDVINGTYLLNFQTLCHELNTCNLVKVKFQISKLKWKLRQKYLLNFQTVPGTTGGFSSSQLYHIHHETINHQQRRLVLWWWSSFWSVGTSSAWIRIWKVTVSQSHVKHEWLDEEKLDEIFSTERKNQRYENTVNIYLNLVRGWSHFLVYNHDDETIYCNSMFCSALCVCLLRTLRCIWLA